jgi:hypothetical protein
MSETSADEKTLVLGILQATHGLEPRKETMSGRAETPKSRWPSEEREKEVVHSLRRLRASAKTRWAGMNRAHSRAILKAKMQKP